ncbi:MAG TPA: ABC transporter substrate-binding protein [Solirubrobacteraceae bacterium]|jgi:ABC-type branched-subunit amino acid transport system substrate-binding protein|nr:ABC transporter substrate-binding protein [Solirubrobacteraceae bacterium]
MPSKRSIGAPKRRSRWHGAVVVVSLVAALVLAACGSSSNSSSSAGGGAAASTSSGSASTSQAAAQNATGSPIVTYTIADVNTQGPQYKNIEETARVSAAWINAHGGINGHPIQEHFCDGQGTPTAAAACARAAVAAHAVAVNGSFTFTGDAIIPILAAAHIPYFGNCCAVSASELTSPDSFPLGNQPLYAVGAVQKAQQDGCKHMVGVIIQGAESFEPLMTNAANALHTKIYKYVSLPATAKDYSSQVAEATSGGTDCLLMVVSETPYVAWNAAFTQSGSTARMYGPQGNLDAISIKGFTQATNGDVIAGMYPDIALPQWADYRAALKQYNADPTQDYNSLGGLGTWTAYQAFKQIVSRMKGPITADAFYKAASTAKVNLPGMIPPINFAEPWNKLGGPKGYNRIFNKSVVFSKVANGKIVPLTNSFQDVSALAEGK